MNISNHISSLLYRYQCVTVPGFGAFLTEIQSAHLNQTSHTFYPPKKLISFNAHLQNNDGLLANHIAISEKISYNQAVNSMQNEVFEWKKSLEETGFFTLKNVGDFTLNTENNLIFSANNTTNYLTNSFGLTAFVSPMVKKSEFEDKIQALEEEEKVISIIPEKSKKSYLKYAAIFVLGLGLTVTASIPIYQQHIADETLIVEKSVQKKLQNKIQEATFFIKNPIPAVTLTVKEAKMSYHIMADAFRDERNAQKKLIQLSNKGFKARRIAKNKYNLYPVLFGSYATYAEAEKAVKIIRKTENPEAWILIESL